MKGTDLVTGGGVHTVYLVELDDHECGVDGEENVKCRSRDAEER